MKGISLEKLMRQKYLLVGKLRCQESPKVKTCGLREEEGGTSVPHRALSVPKGEHQVVTGGRGAVPSISKHLSCRKSLPALLQLPLL